MKYYAGKIAKIYPKNYAKKGTILKRVLKRERNYAGKYAKSSKGKIRNTF